MAIDRKYISEIDEFINNLLIKNPKLKQQQKELRNTWWDRNYIDQQEQGAYQENAAPKYGYTYFDYSNDIKKN